MIRRKMSVDRQAETISSRRRFLQGHYTSSARTTTAQKTRELFVTLDEKHDVWHLVASVKPESSHETIQGLEGTVVNGNSDREIGNLAATVDSLSSRMSGNENHVHGMISSDGHFDFGDGYLRIADTNHENHDDYSSDLFGHKIRGPDGAHGSSLDEDESYMEQVTRRELSQKEHGRSSRVDQNTQNISEIESAQQGVNDLHSEARTTAGARTLNSSRSYGPPNLLPHSDDHDTQRDLAQDEQRGGGTRTHGYDMSVDVDFDVESTAIDADQGPRHPKGDLERSREDTTCTPCVASSVQLVAERGKADGRKCMIMDRSLMGEDNTTKLGGSPNNSPRATGQKAPSAVEHQSPSRLIKDLIASNAKSGTRRAEEDDQHQVRGVGISGGSDRFGRAARGAYRITWRGRDVLVPQCSVKVVDTTGTSVSARACAGESIDRSSTHSSVWRRSSSGEGGQQRVERDESIDPDGRRVLSPITHLSEGDFVGDDDDCSEEKRVEHGAYRWRDEERETHAKAAAPESGPLGSFLTDNDRMRHGRHRPGSQVHDEPESASLPRERTTENEYYKSSSPYSSRPARVQRSRLCSIQCSCVDRGEAPRQGVGSRPGYHPQDPLYFSASPYMGPPVSACPRAWAEDEIVREMHDACATATLSRRGSFPRRNPTCRDAPDCHKTGVVTPGRVRAEHPRVAYHGDTGEHLTESDGKSGKDRYCGNMSSHGYRRSSGDDFGGCSSEAQAKNTAEIRRFHECDDAGDMKAKATWDK